MGQIHQLGRRLPGFHQVGRVDCGEIAISHQGLIEHGGHFRPAAGLAGAQLPQVGKIRHQATVQGSLHRLSGIGCDRSGIIKKTAQIQGFAAG